MMMMTTTMKSSSSCSCSSRSVVLVAILLSLATAVSGQCANYFNASGDPNPGPEVTKSLKLWQGVLLIVCFGAFGLLVAVMHRLVRAYIFYDDHLVDTYFDAGGEANFAMVACCVVAKRLWTASYTFSTDDVSKFGIVGHFWYSAAGVIHLLLFAILASEIRVKAPGARTFLQVIRSRFGKAPHITVMIFAFITNLIIAGIVMSEGTRILTWLCQDISEYVICIILTLAVGVYTLVGGVGGAMYMAYFCVALVVSLCLVYFSDSVFDPLNRPDYRFTDFFPDTYSGAYCSDTSGQLLTFLSKSGLLQGIIFALAGFSSVFVNQGFWLTAISARPSHSVWGFLTGAFVWFSIPFLLSFVLGMSYWKFSADQGYRMVNSTQAAFGVLPVIVSQQLLGRIGDFMMYSLTLAVVLGSVSSEILSMSSIVVYDIFQTYVNPMVDFSRQLMPNTCGVVATSLHDDYKMAAVGESYLRYNRKCVIVQWVTVVIMALLVYPVTLIIMAIGMQPQWLFNFLAIIVGSSVLPIILSVVWHRTTGAGVMTGVIVGFVAGFASWLIYASRFPNGLSWFQGNTGRPEVLITGLAASLGTGGLLCIFISLSCGGCDPHRNEEEEWEKCRTVDSPILPWAVRYSTDLSSVNQHTGLPHFYALRRIHKCAEVSAYVVGILLSIGALFVWPAVMLAAGVFSGVVYFQWGIMVFVWAIIAAAFICLIPLFYEIIEKCCVSYHIRSWKHRIGLKKPSAAATGAYHEFAHQTGTIVRPTGTYRSCGTVARPTGTYYSSGTVVRRTGTGTCRPCGTFARQTYRLADMTVTGANLYPTKYRSSTGFYGPETSEYRTYPVTGYIETIRGGTIAKGWQTMVHVN